MVRLWRPPTSGGCGNAGRRRRLAATLSSAILRCARKEQNSGKTGEEEDTGEPTSRAGKLRQIEAAVLWP